MRCASSADVRTSEAGAEESPGLPSSAPSLASPAARSLLEPRWLLGFLDHLIGDEVALGLRCKLLQVEAVLGLCLSDVDDQGARFEECPHVQNVQNQSALRFAGCGGTL